MGYYIIYWLPTEVGTSRHDLGTDNKLAALRAALAYENRGYQVELWQAQARIYHS